MPVQTYTTLDDPSATAGTFVQGINSSGQIVGYYHDNQGSGLHGFLLSGGTYATLDDTVAFFGTTLASGINASGQIVGWYSDSANHQHGFLYDGRTYTTLDVPFSIQTEALGINDRGQIVGYYLDTSVHAHGFLYSNAPTPPSTIPWVSMAPMQQASTLQGRSSGNTPTPTANTTASSRLPCRTRRRPPAPPPT